jgi:cellulose synthase/poly-beta-1,6-N-acetylglucosamine synthase-like glycosyltransferase
MGATVIEVITSVNQHYWDMIGRDSIESWLAYWSDDFCLTVYTEEFQLPDYGNRVRQIDFDQLDPDYWQLQQEDLHDSIKRFAKKAYSFMHAMSHSRSSWIIWLDADVVTQKSVDRSVWRKILDKNCLASYLGVTYYTDKQGNPGDWLVPETGVFAVNRRHHDYKQFRQEYQRRYHQRDYQDLRRFYDNDVFGAAIRSISGTQVNDLCAGFAKAYKTPLKHTVLGPYLIHYKAKHSKVEYQSSLAESNMPQNEGVADPLPGSDPTPCDDL